jgi:hypothetical protein
VLPAEEVPVASRSAIAINLRSIVAKCIRDSDWENLKDLDALARTPCSSHAVDRSSKVPLSRNELAHLETQGYTPRDVLLWASALVHQNTFIATRALLIQEVESAHQGRRTGVPFFVLIFTLRRNDISADSLRNLLKCSWLFLRRNLVNRHPSESLPGEELIDAVNVFRLFRVLLRRARASWPESIPNVAAIVTTFIPRTLPRTDQLSNRTVARLASFYNRALVLLSIGAPSEPFKAMVFQQRAQFDVLAEMAKHSKSLPITPQGYHAVIRVQLADGKSAKDRAWAELKSKTWPPWKESKTRLDDEKGPEDGISNALQAILWMQQAGYAMDNWVKAARLLAGWDTDGSPTIQTRTLLRRFDKGKDLGPEENSPLIWAARIQATRTLHQAWACFLEYEDTNTSPHAEVYLRMFEKVVWDRRTSAHTERRSKNLAGQLTPLPGDGLEVDPPAVSPVEATYTRTPPPSFEQFFEHMIAKGLPPSDALLTFVISRAPSFPIGLRILYSITAQLGASDGIGVYGGEELPLDLLPPSLLSPVISFLCRFPLRKLEVSGIDTDAILPDWKIQQKPSLVVAISLLYKHEGRSRGRWLMVLRALSRHFHDLRPILSSNHMGQARALDAILPLQFARSIITNMNNRGLDLDAECFQFLCRIFTKAVLAARRIASESPGSYKEIDFSEVPVARLDRMFVDEIGPSTPPLRAAKLLLGSGSYYIRYLFQSLVNRRDNAVNSFDMDQWLQGLDASPVVRIANTPRPAALHAYVRALGALGDHEGLLSLTKWMRAHKEELDMVVEAGLNGGYRRRLMLTAIRVLLECPNDIQSAWRTDVRIPRASDDVIALVKNEIEHIEGWLGWPSDEEVKEYVTTSKSRAKKVDDRQNGPSGQWHDP